jgi:hypothetical protein
MRIEDNGNLILNEQDVLEGINEVKTLSDCRLEVEIAGRYAVLAGYEVHYERPGKTIVIAKPKGKERKNEARIHSTEVQCR